MFPVPSMQLSAQPLGPCPGLHPCISYCSVAAIKRQKVTESMKKSLFGLRIPERSIMIHHGKGSQQQVKIRWQEWKAEGLLPSCEDKAKTNWKGSRFLTWKAHPPTEVSFPYQGSTTSNLPQVVSLSGDQIFKCLNSGGQFSFEPLQSFLLSKVT